MKTGQVTRTPEAPQLGCQQLCSLVPSPCVQKLAESSASFAIKENAQVPPASPDPQAQV